MANTAWQYYKNLKNNGVPEAQAEIEADALYGALENLATKDELKTEITLVRQDLLAMKNELLDEMDARFDKMDARFTKIDARFDKMDLNYRWLMGIGITIIGAIVTMIFK
jgi:hypothetical protein